MSVYIFVFVLLCVVLLFQKDIFYLQGIPDSITHPMEAVIYLLKKEYKESKDQVLTFVTAFISLVLDCFSKMFVKL